MAGIMKKTLILASSSRYRRELLDRLGLSYSAESPDVDESSLPGETPRETALRLAEMKARAVWEKHPGAVVIGSDQTANLDGKKLGIALMGAVESDDPTSLIGLPLMKLTTLLAKAGIEVLPGLFSAQTPQD